MSTALAPLEALKKQLQREISNCNKELDNFPQRPIPSKDDIAEVSNLEGQLEAFEKALELVEAEIEKITHSLLYTAAG